MQTWNNNFYITCTFNDMLSTYFPLYSDPSHWQAPYAPIDPATKHCFQFLRWQNLTVESLYSNLDNYSREIEILKNEYARYRVNILKEKSNYTVGDWWHPVLDISRRQVWYLSIYFWPRFTHWLLPANFIAGFMC